MKELILYCDESTKKGQYYSNFYGGALTTSLYLDNITNSLNEIKAKNNLHDEIKWVKVTEAYLDKYISVIDLFFDFVTENKIKIRIMFSQNAFTPTGLSQEQIDKEYFLLYYQFIKHAFGFKYCTSSKGSNLKIFFDRLPNDKDSCVEFKAYIQRLQTTPEFLYPKIKIRNQDIGEVKSHDHVILQCIDIILGAMQFRLNNLHEKKLPDSKKRGKRTKAKEKLYKHILHRIQKIYPNFNIGISTGTHDNANNIWIQPYRHWNFISTSSQYDETLTKKKRCPVKST